MRVRVTLQIDIHPDGEDPPFARLERALNNAICGFEYELSDRLEEVGESGSVNIDVRDLRKETRK